MTARARAFALATTALTLVLAACGGEERSATDDPPSDDGATVAPSDGATAEDPTGTVPENEPVALEDAAGLTDHVAAVSDLGAHLAATAGEDSLVVSPASAATLLAILAAGAQGETLAEMEDVLGGGSGDVVEAIGALRASRADLEVEPAAGDLDPWPEDPLLHLADQVVLAEGVTPGDAWLGDVQGLGAEVVEAPGEDLEAVLDEWVALHTGGLVEDSAITPGDATGLVVQDAALLSARWNEDFDPSLTEDLPFTLAGGEQVEVAMMRDERTLPWAEVGDATATSIDLEGGFDVQVVLPAEGTAPSGLTAEDWRAVDDALDDGEEVLVDLGLPRADLGTSVDLTGALPGLGVTTVLSEDADLSGIFEGAFVDQAVQQATLAVTEEGVVAAAVSESAVAGAVPPPPKTREMIVDRPYALRIVDDETGWVLVHAVVADPSPAQN
ncbi:MAG: serpin family protein [Actinomycetaceae bacterium]